MFHRCEPTAVGEIAFGPRIEQEDTGCSSFRLGVDLKLIDELGIDYIEKRNAIVDAVTLEGTKRVAKRIWGQGLLSVSVGRAAQAATEPATSTAPKAN